MAISDRTKLFHNSFNRKLIEAIVLIVKDEINLLRAQHGLVERTNQQIMNAITDKLSSLSDYRDD